VCEDEWPARNYLVRLLQESELAEVIGAVGSAEEAREAIAAGMGEIDVAFVDVELARSGAKREGLAIVRDFAETPGAPAFVLATAFPDHALEAFRIGVVDYLLKPFTGERVVQCLGRVGARRPPAALGEHARPLRLVARKKKSLVFLAPEEVWAFEAAERLTFVHTPHGKFDVDLSLAAIEASLGRSLLRVHRNWLVNEVHVRELSLDGGERTLFVGRTLDDTSGVRVPVARERAAAVRERLTGAQGVSTNVDRRS
jgi:DNA-binding LytR/AlgR family response regulator